MNPAPRLAPDLFGRGADMTIAIGDIVELVGPDRAVRLAFRHLLGQPAGKLHVIVGVAVRHRRHFDQLGPKQAQRILLFLALRFGNYDDSTLTQRLGDQGEADSRVARSAFDDAAARLAKAALSSNADD